VPICFNNFVIEACNFLISFLIAPTFFLAMFMLCKILFKFFNFLFNCTIFFFYTFYFLFGRCLPSLLGADLERHFGPGLVWQGAVEGLGLTEGAITDDGAVLGGVQGGAVEPRQTELGTPELGFGTGALGVPIEKVSINITFDYTVHHSFPHHWSTNKLP